MGEFVVDIGGENGARWMKTPESYSFSKIAINALVGLYAQKLKGDASIMAMCPGWVGVQ